ncbi:S-layer homology domain-containing protein [Alkalicoccus urumqiensis]|uniref:SLH domain-containing protein n=1 Tax=Alkalicoccus urumqiensis TaxID=1548213 RepID=A0A2P6ML45_ALKUR|nr:S-layer homology domain-containing protein [Alkalicoccus urumqiensis]PRO67002.1 hypothetical protein C6I21_00080 [Alkalicoccus urumqiensis]
MKYILLTVLMFISGAGTAAAAPFADMEEGDLFYTETGILYENDLTSGYEDGTYRPEQPVTRAEAAVFLQRVQPLPQAETEQFPDTAETSFAADAIARAAGNGRIQGFPDGTFRPGAAVTRGQLAVLLERTYAFPQAERTFPDVSSSHFAAGAASALAEAGIVRGYPDGTFRADRAVTRGEFAAMLVRAEMREAAGEDAEALTGWWETILLEEEWEAPVIDKLLREQRDLLSSGNTEHAFLTSSTLTEAAGELRTARKEAYLAGPGSRIESDMESGSFMEKVFTYEEAFAADSYRGMPEAPDYVLDRSSSGSRILVTAPHSVSHIREGDVKIAEGYTGAFIRLLHEYLDVNVLYLTRESRDPNYYSDMAFKEELGRLASSGDIDYVIDLHGASRTREFDVDAGTYRGTLTPPQPVNALMEVMRGNGVEDVRENDTFTAGYRHTIAYHTFNEYDVPAVQLEINRTFREPRADEAPLKQLFTGLSEWVWLLDEQPDYVTGDR